MRKSILFILIFLSGFTCMAENYVIKEITKNVFTITPEKKQLHTLGWPNDIINSIVIKTDKGLVLVDTQNSPANATLIKKGIYEKLNDTTFAYVINTHGYSCHSGGNCVFSNNTIVAQINSLVEIKDYDDLFLDQTVEFLRKKIYYKSFVLDTFKTKGVQSDSVKQAIDLYKFYENDLINNFKVRYPDITFEDTLTLKAGNTTIELTFMGKGHGNADVSVYIPEEKVICTGNLFHLGTFSEEGMPSFYLNRVNDINKWIKSLTYILSNSHEIKYVLTTHGKRPLLRQNLEFVRDYCILVCDIVKEAKLKNQPIESIQNLDKFKTLFDQYKSVVSMNSKVEEMHARNISIIWKYVE